MRDGREGREGKRRERERERGRGKEQSVIHGNGGRLEKREK